MNTNTLKFFKKIGSEGALPNLFSESSVILLPKPDDDAKEVSYKPISLMNIHAKILNNIGKLNLTAYQKLIQHDQVSFILGIQSVQHSPITNCNTAY
jgi:hypothetical protein